MVMRAGRRHQTPSIRSSLPLCCEWSQDAPLRQSSASKISQGSDFKAKHRGAVQMCGGSQPADVLQVTLKEPGNCNWDRQLSAPEGLCLWWRPQFLKIQKEGIWAEKCWLLLDEKNTWAFMQSVKANFPKAQRCSEVLRPQTLVYKLHLDSFALQMRGNVFLKAYWKRIKNNRQRTFNPGFLFALYYYITVSFNKIPLAVLVNLHLIGLLLCLSKQTSSLWDWLMDQVCPTEPQEPWVSPGLGTYLPIKHGEWKISPEVIQMGWLAPSWCLTWFPEATHRTAE